MATLRAHTGLVKGVVFDPVGKYLASQSDDRSLRVWRTSDWREEAAVTAPFEECGATTHVLRPGKETGKRFSNISHSVFSFRFP